jgi:hypothetical protein
VSETASHSDHQQRTTEHAGLRPGADGRSESTTRSVEPTGRLIRRRSVAWSSGELSGPRRLPSSDVRLRVARLGSCVRQREVSCPARLVILPRSRRSTPRTTRTRVGTLAVWSPR